MSFSAFPGTVRPASLPEALTRHPGLWRGRDLAPHARTGTGTGFPALDRELPGGGWPGGYLTEIFVAHEGIGELRLLGPALAALTRTGRHLAWIAPPYLPYAPALAAAGIAMERMLIVRTAQARDALWAAEQGLRSEACGAVLLWADVHETTALRRLQLAAERTHALAFLFAPLRLAAQPSPAALRLRLESAAGGLAVHILKRRGLPLHQPVLIPADLASERTTLPSHVLDRPAISPLAAGNLPARHAHA